MNINIHDFSCVTCDSRRIIPGSIFVAIKGRKENGNGYIDEAIAKGAKLIITEDYIPSNRVPFIQVKHPRQTLALLTSAFYGHPSKKLTITGVTGTNGKTSTSHMLASILTAAGIPTGVIGTTGIYYGICHQPSPLTTPDAELLSSTLYNMVESNIKHLVMEVSSHGIALDRVYGIDFDAAIYTNISNDHMDLHKNFQDYLNTKRKLFANLKDNQAAIINSDDAFGNYICEGTSTSNVMNYGLLKGRQNHATNIDYLDETHFVYRLTQPLTSHSKKEYGPLTMDIALPANGIHNVYNALAAITAALYYDIPPEKIQQGLKNYQGVPRRFQRLHYGPYNIIDDFCHNPAGYDVVFKTLKDLAYDNLYVVSAIRGNRGTAINNQIAETIGQWSSKLPIKKIYLTSSEDVVGSKDKVSQEERECFISSLNKYNTSYEHIQTLNEALSKVLSTASSRDLILLSGAQGMDPASEVLETLTLKHIDYPLISKA